MLLYQLMANMGIGYDHDGYLMFLNGQEITKKEEFKRNVTYALHACKLGTGAHTADLRWLLLVHLLLTPCTGHRRSLRVCIPAGLAWMCCVQARPWRRLRQARLACPPSRVASAPTCRPATSSI